MENQPLTRADNGHDQLRIDAAGVILGDMMETVGTEDARNRGVAGGRDGDEFPRGARSDRISHFKSRETGKSCARFADQRLARQQEALRVGAR